MVTVFYFIVFIFALVLTGSFLVRNKNVDSVFILFSILVTINCFGRYMLATAENLEMAIWANKFMYIGGAYAPLLTVVVLAKLLSFATLCIGHIVGYKKQKKQQCDGNK